MPTISMKIWVAYVVLTTLVLHQINGICLTGGRFKILILNDFPDNKPPVIFHCTTGTRDLGTHTLNMNMVYQFSVCEYLFTRRIFNCYFQRGPLHLSYNVFDSRHDENCRGRVCFWSTKSDGLYFTQPSGSLGKVMDWQTDHNLAARPSSVH